MSHELAAVVVAARCSRRDAYLGIRFERRDDAVWVADWAFALTPRASRREGYESAVIEGNISIDPAYPGCPHCRAPSFWHCNACSGVSCWNGESMQARCAHCGVTATLSGSIDKLFTGGDR